MTASASPHATVLTVLNLKGGVGKTHTTWLLASVSHERGKRLLAIDTDPQGNLTNSFLHRSFVEPVNELRGRYDLIVFDCPPRLSLTSFAALCASDFVIVPLEAADWGAQGAPAPVPFRPEDVRHGDPGLGQTQGRGCPKNLSADGFVVS